MMALDYSLAVQSRGRLIRTVVGATAAWACACAPALGAAVTYQGDAAHTGNVDAPFSPPLGKKWIRRDLGTNLSYPVVGDGKVFVTARKSSSEALLYALDRRTGGTVWTRPVLGTQPAYDGGRVFVAGSKLQAYDSATGKSLWLLEPDAFGSAPVTDGTTVFASSQVAVNSFEELTGAPVATSTEGGGQSGVALDGPRVYTANGCAVSFYTKGLGQPTWTYGSNSCSPGSSYPPAVFGGRVWSRGSAGSGVVLDQNLGLKTDSFSSYGGPAFAGNLAFFRGQTQIQARRIDTGTIAWTYTPPASPQGSTSLKGSLLVVRGVLYGLTADDTLVELNAANGASLAGKDLKGPLGGSDSSSSDSYPYTSDDGMAADASGLLVPTGSRLVALGPGADAPHVDDVDKHPASGTKLTARASKKYVYYGGSAHVSGTVSRSSSSSSYGIQDQLELQASTYPYDVWRTVRRQRLQSGSNGYSFSVPPDRNTRYRVVDIDTAPAVVSHVMRVTLYLGGGARYLWAGHSRVGVRLRVAAPPWLGAEKRGVYFYRVRSRRSRTATRVGHLKLHRTGAGHFKAGGKLKVPSLRRTDLFIWCVPIRAWHEIGKFKRADRCGRARL